MLPQVNYIGCMLLAYPLAVLFRFLPHSAPMLRHLYGLVMGVAFGYFCFRE